MTITAPTCLSEPLSAYREAQAELLPQALLESWTADTSADQAWSPQNPALGQCAVTALVVQDYLGGALARTTVNGVSHYYNILPDGTELDLTREQFPSWEPGEVVERDRGYVLSFPATAARYELLMLRTYAALDALLATAGI